MKSSFCLLKKLLDLFFFTKKPFKLQCDFKTKTQVEFITPLQCIAFRNVALGYVGHLVLVLLAKDVAWGTMNNLNGAISQAVLDVNRHKRRWSVVNTIPLPIFHCYPCDYRCCCTCWSRRDVVAGVIPPVLGWVNPHCIDAGANPKWVKEV